MQRIGLILLTLSLTGCWFGNDELRERLERGKTSHVVIPEGLDTPVFVDSMPIPEVDDTRGLADQDFKIGLPDALSTTFGVEKVVIRKLGDDRWVFLDTPPSTVWSGILEFWENNNLIIASADPGTGIIESNWLPSNGTGEAVFDTIKQDLLQTSANWQHKFRLRIEPGVRTGSTEVSLKHRRRPLTGPVRLDVDWRDKSDDGELEGAVLTALAWYLGENIDQEQTVSLIASGLQEQRTELVTDRERPVLKYRLDFNRAWATVGAALENARINVEDLNRTEANYYVSFSIDHKPKQGFFSRLLKRGDGPKQSGGGDKYLVHLQSDNDEVHVTVLKDKTTLADALTAERLLKIIKEYST